MNSYELRAKARESLKDNYWPSVAVAFVAVIFGALASGSSPSFSINVDTEALQLLPDRIASIVTVAMIILGAVGGMFNLVHFILGGVVQLGYARYLLKQHDREVTSVKELFSQFDRFGQAFLQKFLRGLYVFLWSLLLIVPGIIKRFSYAMTPYIMAENPDMTAKEAITRSRELMDGHKWELFCLGLSFIGWSLLAGLTLGIGSFFLHPYVEAAYAAFYRDKISPKTAIHTCAEAVPELDMPM